MSNYFISRFINNRWKAYVSLLCQQLVIWGLAHLYRDLASDHIGGIRSQMQSNFALIIDTHNNPYSQATITLHAARIASRQLSTILQQLRSNAAATGLLTNQGRTALGSAHAAGSAGVLTASKMLCASVGAYGAPPCHKLAFEVSR